jgi:hypothetical protein
LREGEKQPTQTKERQNFKSGWFDELGWLYNVCGGKAKRFTVERAERRNGGCLRQGGDDQNEGLSFMLAFRARNEREGDWDEM